MVGLDGSGKTAVLYRIKNNEFQETQTTVGLNLETIEYRDMELLMFDVGGKGRHMWQYYFDGIDCLLFVVDSTDWDRLSIVKEEVKRITDLLKDRKYIILLYLNKQDLKNTREYKEIIHDIGITDITHHVDVIIQKCSAFTGEGIAEGLDKLQSNFERREITLIK
jgi:ADP-ribosylation factor protein 1